MNKRILKLAIPNILSNLSIPLLSSVDTAVVGRLDEVYYLGAIAVGSMIFNFIYWGFGFLRMGTTGMTAQAYGRESDDESASVFGRAILTAVFVGFVLIAFSWLIDKFAFGIISSSAEVSYFAREYFYIRIFAAPAALSLFVFHGWFLGMQNAKYPLYLAVFVNIANIALNLFFIYVMGKKSDGVAWGTLISQYIGLTFAILLFLKKYKSFIFKLRFNEIINLEKIKSFFKINFDIFIRTLALIFVFSYFTTRSAGMGDDLLAANTILMQLWMILAYGVDGFAFAAESLTGKYIGNNNLSKLKELIKYSLYWGIGLGLTLSIVYYVFDTSIVGIFTNKETIIELAMGFMIYTYFAPFINSFAMILDGIYIGATATKAMRNNMLIVSFIVFLPLQLILEPSLGNHSIWIAMLAFMAARGITLSITLKSSVLSQCSE